MKLVPTVAVSPDEQARASRNAVQTQYLDVHHRDADDCVTCYFSTDPEWVNMLGLASWRDLVVEMRCWESSASDSGACIVLTSPQKDRSLYSVRDDDCPVALKLIALHNVGWKGVQERCAQIDRRKSWTSEFRFQRQVPELPYGA